MWHRLQGLNQKCFTATLYTLMLGIGLCLSELTWSIIEWLSAEKSLDKNSIQNVKIQVIQTFWVIGLWTTKLGIFLGAFKWSKNWRYCPCPANSWTFEWLRWPQERTVPSPVGDGNIGSLISTFMLSTAVHWHSNKVHFLFFLSMIDYNRRSAHH